MVLRQFTPHDLFDEQGRIPMTLCSRTSRAGGDCYSTFRLHSDVAIPPAERQRILDAVNDSPWRIGEDGSRYCSMCVPAISSE